MRKQTIMAVNAGSSSLKFQLFEMPDAISFCQGLIERIGSPNAIFTVHVNQDKTSHTLPIRDHQHAVDCLLRFLTEHQIVRTLDQISGVGHRVAHGGEFFADSVIIDDSVIEKIHQLSELAPLHNPVNLIGIKAFQQAIPHATAVAVFDTAFHHTMNEIDYLYPIPYQYYQQYGVRRYGFHGTSHKYVAHQYASLIDRPLSELNVITCHLGNGSSICAIESGQSVHTSMGFTPLAGVMMGTRSGDIDPSILPFLAEKAQMSVQDLNRMMSNQSGLLGISGVSHDCRDVLQAADNNHRARLAIDMFTERVRAFIGQYLVKLQRVDAIIFTGGIGENSPAIRQQISTGLEALGIHLNIEKNRAGSMIISTESSSITLAVIPTNEELMIAQDVIRVGQ